MEAEKTFYRFGQPHIGKEHAAFRTLRDATYFRKLVGLPIKEDVYAVKGRVTEDDGGRDGLYVLVESFEKVDL
tara:strand:+ start:402 stop:620 length:219 start_codon:yes stop_codon:yes gene_type:complete